MESTCRRFWLKVPVEGKCCQILKKQMPNYPHISNENRYRKISERFKILFWLFMWFSTLINRVLIFALQVVKMFGFVVVSFAVCWLPYHIYFLYTYHDKDIVRMAITKHVYLGIYWMAMINTSVNPFIYFMMNLKFRNYFIKAFLFLPRQEKNLWI